MSCCLKMVLLIALLVSMSVISHGYGGNSPRCDCLVDHPQKRLCAADFAFVGTIVNEENMSDKDLYRYEVQVRGAEWMFKGANLIGTDEATIDVFTPYGVSICGRTNLDQGKEYLFTGFDFEGNLMITLCDWIEDWKVVTEKQREYLLGTEYLDHCRACEPQLRGTIVALEMDQNKNDLVYSEQKSGLWTPYGCYFNPVPSYQYNAADCETDYSICHLADDEGRCDWELNPDYEECFREREEEWAKKNGPRPAAALTHWTTLKDCRKLETRRMKKKCIKKVRQYLKNNRESINPREMLEEMLELREFFLDDKLFDEEDE